MINRRSARSISTIVQLIGRITDNDIELHVASEQLGRSSFNIIAVNECVGMSFKLITSVQGFLPGPAI